MKSEIVAFIKSLRLLVVKPEQFFSEFMNRPYDRDVLLRTSFYPVLGLYSLCVFLIMLLHGSLITSIKGALAIAFPYLAALFVCDFVLRRLGNKLLNRTLEPSRTFPVVTYCLIIMMLIGLASSIVPFLFWIKILYLYVFYLFFIACRVMLDVDVEKHFWFYFFASLSIIAIPYVLESFVKLF